MKTVCIFVVILFYAVDSTPNRETAEQEAILQDEVPLKLDKRATHDEKLAVIAACIDQHDYDDTEGVELCLFKRGVNFLEPFVRENAERLLKEKYRAFVAEVNRYRREIRDLAEAPSFFSYRRMVQWKDV